MPDFIFDNTVLSNFAAIGKVDLLAKHFENNAFTTIEVMDKLKRGIEKGYHPPAGLRSRNPAGGSWLRTSRRVSLCTLRARCYLPHEGGYP